MQSITARMPLLTATSAFGLGRRCWSSPQLHCLRILKFDNLQYAYFQFQKAYCLCKGSEKLGLGSGRTNAQSHISCHYENCLRTSF